MTDEEQSQQYVRDARAMLERLDRIDRIFREERATRDLHERLAEGAAREAETAQETARHSVALLRYVMVVVAVGLLFWTPVVAYGAVWFHEKVRNTCYPFVQVTEPFPALYNEPFYCGMFPGTNRMNHG